MRQPDQLINLKTSTTEAWESIGNINYELKGEEENMIKFRRSLYIVNDIKAGEKLSKSNLRRIRPGYGIEPKFYEKVLEKRVKIDLKSGTALSWEMIDE